MNHRFLLPTCSATFVICALGLLVSSHTTRVAARQTQERQNDRQALIDLENEWLANEHNSAKLESILADDFVHPVVTGNFLTKAQHIFYTTKYQPPANLKNRFGDLKVRVYGDVGIVNGIVISSDEHGKDVNKSIFTDVFAYREGRWRAINAQENEVVDRPPPK